jgi:ribosomal protein S18 acetylase RimI-like enzyme
MKPLIVDIDNSYRETVRQLLSNSWGSDFMVTRGQIHHYDDLDGYLAIDNNKIVGVLTFIKFNDEVEIISLDSFKENTGVGTALLNKIIDFAKQNSIKRLWLITTNDNLNALRFYQKRNWSITALHKDAVTNARKIKPTIAITGYYEIPLRHEIELEYEPLIHSNDEYE